MRVKILPASLSIAIGLAFGCSPTSTRLVNAGSSSANPPTTIASASTSITHSQPSVDVDRAAASSGPRFDKWTKIAGTGAHFVRFDRDSSHVYFTLPKDGNHVVMVVPTSGNSAARVYAPYPYDWDGDAMLCPPAEDPCVLLPLMMFRSAHATLVNRSKHFQREYWGDPDGVVPHDGLSPDGAYFVTVSPDIVRFVRTDSANDAGIEKRTPWNAWGVFRAWIGQGADLRAIIEVRERGKPKILDRLAIDPRTGASTKVAVDAKDVQSDDPGVHPSPDGAHTLSCSDEHHVIVTTLADNNARTFVVDDASRSDAGRWCPVRWVSNQYVEFAGKHLGFLDVSTMKLLDPGDDGTPFTRIEYNASFTWAARETSEGLEVARIVTP